MSSESFISAAHGTGQLVFHFEWCPKYRYKMLRQDRFKVFLEGVFADISIRHSFEILEKAVQAEHIHIVLRLKAYHSVSQVFYWLKRESAEALFEHEPKFRLRYPKGCFWSTGKFYRSVGDIDLETTKEYVRRQDWHQRSLAEF